MRHSSCVCKLPTGVWWVCTGACCVDVDEHHFFHAIQPIVRNGFSGFVLNEALIRTTCSHANHRRINSCTRAHQGSHQQTGSTASQSWVELYACFFTGPASCAVTLANCIRGRAFVCDSTQREPALACGACAQYG